VLGIGVGFEGLAVGGALEVLEAGLALDRLGGSVLEGILAGRSLEHSSMPTGKH
jgi:hypothetical protein